MVVWVNKAAVSPLAEGGTKERGRSREQGAGGGGFLGVLRSAFFYFAFAGSQYMRFYICLFVSLFIYLPICLPVYLSVCLSIYLFSCLIYLCICLPIFLLIYPSIYLSTYLSICLFCTYTYPHPLQIILLTFTILKKLKKKS